MYWKDILVVQTFNVWKKISYLFGLLAWSSVGITNEELSDCAKSSGCVYISNVLSVKHLVGNTKHNVKQANWKAAGGSMSGRNMPVSIYTVMILFEPPTREEFVQTLATNCCLTQGILFFICQLTKVAAPAFCQKSYLGTTWGNPGLQSKVFLFFHCKAWKEVCCCCNSPFVLQGFCFYHESKSGNSKVSLSAADFFLLWFDFFILRQYSFYSEGKIFPGCTFDFSCSSNLNFSTMMQFSLPSYQTKKKIQTFFKKTSFQVKIFLDTQKNILLIDTIVCGMYKSTVRKTIIPSSYGSLLEILKMRFWICTFKIQIFRHTEFADQNFENIFREYKN